MILPNINPNSPHEILNALRLLDEKLSELYGVHGRVNFRATPTSQAQADTDTEVPRFDQIVSTASFVPVTRQLTAGNGLSGGGTLAADRTFAVNAGDGIAIVADAVTVDEADTFTWTASHVFSALTTFNADVDLAGNDLLNVGSLQLNSATTDHDLYDSAGDLFIRNQTSNKAIKFNVNSAGTAQGFVTIDANQLQFLVSNTAAKVIGDGIMKVTGSWSTGIAAAAMTFSPTITGGNFYGFLISPVMNTAGSFTGVAFQPTAGNNHRSTPFLRFAPPAHVVSYNDSAGRYSESMTRSFFAFGSGDGATIAYSAFDIGGKITLGDDGQTNVAVTETMIKLSGGTQRVLGTGGSVTQTGLQFAGFGTIAGTTTVKALTADGGIFELRADNCKWYFGAASDAEVYFDGTDLVLDADAVSNTGMIKYMSPGSWTANGTNAVTISNVAPAGVGTATISQWLTVKDAANVVYYIPAWT